MLKKIHDSIQPSDIDIVGVPKSPFSIEPTENLKDCVQSITDKYKQKIAKIEMDFQKLSLDYPKLKEITFKKFEQHYFIQLSYQQLDITIYPARWFLGHGMSNWDLVAPLNTETLKIGAPQTKYSSLHYPTTSDLYKLSRVQVINTDKSEKSPITWMDVLATENPIIHSGNIQNIVQSLIDRINQKPFSSNANLDLTQDCIPCIFKQGPNAKSICHYFYIAWQLHLVQNWQA